MVTINKGYGSSYSLDEIVNSPRDNHSIECSANDIFSQIYGVSSGLGTAITSYVLSKKYEEGNLVKIVKIIDFQDKRPIYAITKKKDLENKVIKDFYEYLTRRGRELLERYRRKN